MPEIIDHNSPDFFCSLHSRDFEESPLGSAPSANVWFMLEYNDRWNSKAFKESSISDEIKSGVEAQLDSIEKSRLLLIKQKSDRQNSITFFVAVAHVHPAQLYRFELDDYAELLNIDLIGLARGEDKYADQRVSEPLFLVCTNGLRDKCCARNGVPAYQTLSEEFGDTIWQSTHHGGHRFSANFLAMPLGLSYGRMDMGSATDTVKAFLRNEMPLENLRGRSTYAKVVQAAEGLLRTQIDALGPQELHLESSHALSDEQWEVKFENPAKSTHYSVLIQRKETDSLAYVSCIGDKQAPIVEYTLLEHAVV